MRNPIDLYERAEAAVVALEAVPLTDAAAAVEADEAAFEHFFALLGPARKKIFPEDVLPASADTVALVGFVADCWSRDTYLERAIEWHGSAVEHHPALAEFLRGAAMAARLDAIARARASLFSREEADFSDEQRDEFEQRVSEQLVGRPAFEPAASVLAVQAPALLSRIRADRARRREYVAAEEARIEREKAEVQRQLREREHARRVALIAWFHAREGLVFNLPGGSVLAGGPIARQLEGSADVEGGAAPWRDQLALLERVKEQYSTLEAMA